MTKADQQAIEAKYSKLWRGMQGSFSSDAWHFTSNVPYPGVQTALEHIASAAPGSSLLDIGCGNGRHTVLAAQLGLRATGIDLISEAVALAEHNATEHAVSIDTVTASFLDPSVDLGVFDTLMDVNFFSHVPVGVWSDYKARILSCLVAEGRLLLVTFSDQTGLVPGFSEPGVDHFVQADGVYNHFHSAESLQEVFAPEFTLESVEQMPKAGTELVFLVTQFRRKRA